MADNKSRVTKIGSHLIIVDDGVFVTKSGAYAEILGEGMRVTSAGMMAEILYDAPSGDPAVSSYHRGTSSTRNHFRLPAEVSGYALDPSWSMWSIVVPEFTCNLLENPSFEDSATDNMSYTVGVTGLVRDATPGAIAGTFSLKPTITGAGTFYQQDGGNQTPIAGPYTFSCWIWASEGKQFKLSIEALTTIAANWFTVDYTGWHRYWVTGVTTAATAMNCTITFADDLDGTPFYTDAWQLEQKLYPTTYCDGDMLGYLDDPTDSPYSWQGLPHASASIRREWAKSGGRLWNLAEDAGFFTTSIVGLGMNPLEIQARTLGSGKEIYTGTTWKNRTFTITGKIFGKSYGELIFKKDNLLKYLKPDHTGKREPLLLQYALTDSRGREVSTPVEIVCSYTSGLEGGVSNFYSENFALQFKAFSGIRNKVWNVSDEFDPVDSHRFSNPAFFNPGFYFANGTTIDGGWSDRVDVLQDGIVLDISWSVSHNRILFIGEFTQIFGEAGLEGMVVLDYGTDVFYDMFSLLPAGSFDVDPIRGVYGQGPSANNVMVYGDFTVKGATTMRKVALLSNVIPGGTWSEPGTGLAGGGGNDIGRVIALPGGDFVMVGDFTTDGTGATALNNVAYYDESADTISGIGGVSGPAFVGVNNDVHDVTYGNDGQLYLCGDFTADMEAVSMSLVARYDFTENRFRAMGEGITTALTTAYLIRHGKDGYVYCAHGLTADGFSNTISRWNGSSWSTFFEVEAGGEITGMDIDPDGNVHMTGTIFPGAIFERHGVDQRYAIASQNVFYSGEVTSGNILANPAQVFISDKGQVAIAQDDFVFYSAIYVTEEITVNNPGTAEAYPIIRLQGDGMRILQLENESVGSIVVFDIGFQLQGDEILSIDFSGEQPRIYSDLRTDLMKYLVPGTSNLNEWRLLPGDNLIRILTQTSSISPRGIRFKWRNTYHSIDPAT